MRLNAVQQPPPPPPPSNKSVCQLPLYRCAVLDFTVYYTQSVPRVLPDVLPTVAPNATQRAPA